MTEAVILFAKIYFCYTRGRRLLTNLVMRESNLLFIQNEIMISGLTISKITGTYNSHC